MINNHHFTSFPLSIIQRVHHRKEFKDATSGVALLPTIILDSNFQQTKLFVQQKGKDFEFYVAEVMAFIGITIAMGMLRLKDYWSTMFFQLHGSGQLCPWIDFFFGDFEIPSLGGL